MTNLRKLSSRSGPGLSPAGNPCCNHARCRPSTYDADAHPHWCTVWAVEKCPAHVHGLGCVSVSEMSAAQLSDLIEGRTRMGATPEDQLVAWNLAIDEERERAEQ